MASHWERWAMTFRGSDVLGQRRSPRKRVKESWHSIIAKDRERVEHMMPNFIFEKYTALPNATQSLAIEVFLATIEAECMLFYLLDSSIFAAGSILRCAFLKYSRIGCKTRGDRYALEFSAGR